MLDRKYPAELPAGSGPCKACGLQLAPVGIEASGLCVLCDASQNLDYAGDRNAGSMIWLPEISQEALNRLAASAFAMLGMEDYRAQANQFLDSLESRRELLASHINPSRDIREATNPLLFYQYGANVETQVRLLPRAGYFKKVFDALAERGSILPTQQLSNEVELIVRAGL